MWLRLFPADARAHSTALSCGDVTLKTSAPSLVLPLVVWDFWSDVRLGLLLLFADVGSVSGMLLGQQPLPPRQALLTEKASFLARIV
jgi:hypothetical protein